MAKRQRYGVYPYINVLDVSVAGSATQQACLPLTMGRGFTSMENYFLKYQVTKTTIWGTCNVHWMYWNKAGLRLSRGRGFIAKTQKICRQGSEADTRKVFQANNRNYRINMKTTQPPAFFQAACKTISL